MFNKHCLSAITSHKNIDRIKYTLQSLLAVEYMTEYFSETNWLLVVSSACSDQR